MKFGSTFRELRKEKGISISTLAGEFISKSQISRFERDESEISFQKLFYLLESISISLEEFLIITNNNEISNFKQFISQLEDAEFSNNIEFLRVLYHQEHQNYKKSSSKYHFLNTIMITNSMLKCAEVISISESEKNLLTEYLFTVENFGYYELIILSRTEYILDLHVQDNYLAEIVKHSNLKRTNTEKLGLILQVLLNSIKINIEKNRLHKAQDYIIETQKILIHSQFYSEKIIFNFLEGYYYYQNDPVRGREIMEKSLDFFYFFDERMYHYYFAQYLKLTNQ